jgi:tRNA modification GTPase
VDTIFALSSGSPPAAVSVIRISGPRAHQAAARLAGSLPAPRTAALRALRDPASGALLDHALVFRFDSPASATGEDIVEFQCHGGRVIVDAVLSALSALEGFRLAAPGEFTRRAFEHGRIDLTEAEGLADLIEAETQSQRKAALALADGALSKRIHQWQERLLALSAEAERAIDYDEDDGATGAVLVSGCAELAAELREWLDRPRTERLKDGVRVVIAGPVNAGKSSLLNVLSGTERAIVTALAGTTRDHIEVPLSLAGVPVLLTDTAGLRAAADPVEALGIARSEALIESADILVWLGAAADAPDHPRRINLFAKSDLPERGAPPAGSLALSSMTGVGVTELLHRIEALARGMLPAEGTITLNRRQAAHIERAAVALADASQSDDLALIADGLRSARSAFDRLTGRAGVEDVLDALFGRFCLGK